MTDKKKAAGRVFLAFAEKASLPRLELRDKRGRAQCSAFVNAYAVAPRPTTMVLPNGAGSLEKEAYALWYCSLIGPTGSGTTLQALYAGLTENNSSHNLYLEGVGPVVLGNKDKNLIHQGYGTHWNYVQQPFTIPLPTEEGKKQKTLKGVHGLLEPRELSVADPMRAHLSAPRKRATKGKSAAAAKESAVLSTGGAMTSDPEIRQKAAENPFFLLLVPGHQADNTSFLHQLFLTFLGKRLPWALRDEWAGAFWQDCLDQETWGTTDALTVWSYGMPQPSRKVIDTELPEGTVPWIVAGYLCRPQPDQIRQTMVRVLVGDRPQPTPALSEHAQEILQLQAHAVHDALAFAGMR